MRDLAANDDLSHFDTGDPSSSIFQFMADGHRRAPGAGLNRWFLVCIQDNSVVGFVQAIAEALTTDQETVDPVVTVTAWGTVDGPATILTVMSAMRERAVAAGARAIIFRTQPQEGVEAGRSVTRADGAIGALDSILARLDFRWVGDHLVANLPGPATRSVDAIIQANEPEAADVSLFRSGDLVTTDVGDHLLLFQALYRVARRHDRFERALRRLNELITADALERDFQSFFEDYPELLLGSDYVALHPQIHLVDERAGIRLTPDFVLQPTSPLAFCDLLELKRPSVPLVVGKGERARPSHQLIKAVSQLQEYQRYFSALERRVAFESHTGLQIFRPRLVLVIGREPQRDRPLVQAESLLAGDVRIVTYDDVVRRALRQRQLWQ